MHRHECSSWRSEQPISITITVSRRCAGLPLRELGCTGGCPSPWHKSEFLSPRKVVVCMSMYTHNCTHIGHSPVCRLSLGGVTRHARTRPRILLKYNESSIRYVFLFVHKSKVIFIIIISHNHPIPRMNGTERRLVRRGRAERGDECTHTSHPVQRPGTRAGGRWRSSRGVRLPGTRQSCSQKVYQLCEKGVIII